MYCWHLITGEYPPQPGGVSDYTHRVARELAAAGDQVHVWAPRCDERISDQPGVVVHRLPAHFSLPSLRALGAALDTWPGSARILVQYVPHAFGWKAMNIPFCLWLERRRQPVWIMFHEVAFPREKAQPWKHRLLATVTGWMAGRIARAAERVFVTIPQWGDFLRRRGGLPCSPEILPVPSTIATEATPAAAALIRSRLAIPLHGSLVGHFGTYGKLLLPQLLELVPLLLWRHSACSVLLIGRGSETFQRRLHAAFPDQRPRLFATGTLSSQATAEALAACDVMLQPYPDGISCRRSSAMAALALGLPIVTTRGHLTETIWEETQAVRLAFVGDPGGMMTQVEALLTDGFDRKGLGARAAQLYREHFSLQKTIARLRAEGPR